MHSAIAGKKTQVVFPELNSPFPMHSRVRDRANNKEGKGDQPTAVATAKDPKKKMLTMNKSQIHQLIRARPDVILAICGADEDAKQNVFDTLLRGATTYKYNEIRAGRFTTPPSQYLHAGDEGNDVHGGFPATLFTPGPEAPPPPPPPPPGPEYAVTENDDEMWTVAKVVQGCKVAGKETIQGATCALGDIALLVIDPTMIKDLDMLAEQLRAPTRQDFIQKNVKGKALNTELQLMFANGIRHIVVTLMVGEDPKATEEEETNYRETVKLVSKAIQKIYHKSFQCRSGFPNKKDDDLGDEGTKEKLPLLNGAPPGYEGRVAESYTFFVPFLGKSTPMEEEVALRATLPFYTGPTLLQAMRMQRAHLYFEQEKQRVLVAANPGLNPGLRLQALAIYRIKNGKGDTQTIMCSRVANGCVKVGDSIQIGPFPGDDIDRPKIPPAKCPVLSGKMENSFTVKATVIGMKHYDTDVWEAHAGQLVGLNISTRDLDKLTAKRNNRAHTLHSGLVATLAPGEAMMGLKGGSLLPQATTIRAIIINTFKDRDIKRLAHDRPNHVRESQMKLVCGTQHGHVTLTKIMKLLHPSTGQDITDKYYPELASVEKKEQYHPPPAKPTIVGQISSDPRPPKEPTTTVVTTTTTGGGVRFDVQPKKEINILDKKPPPQLPTVIIKEIPPGVAAMVEFETRLTPLFFESFKGTKTVTTGGHLGRFYFVEQNFITGVGAVLDVQVFTDWKKHSTEFTNVVMLLRRNFPFEVAHYILDFATKESLKPFNR